MLLLRTLAAIGLFVIAAWCAPAAGPGTDSIRTEDQVIDRAPFLEEIEQPTGANVCQKNMSVSENSTETYEVTSPVTKTEFCFNLANGFKCTTTKNVTEQKERPVTIETTAMVNACCDGFILSNATCQAPPAPPSAEGLVQPSNGGGNSTNAASFALGSLPAILTLTVTYLVF